MIKRQKEMIAMSIMMMLLGLAGYFAHLSGKDPVMVVTGIVFSLVIFFLTVWGSIASRRRYGLGKTVIGLAFASLIAALVASMIFVDGLWKNSVSTTTAVTASGMQFFNTNIIIVIFFVIVVFAILYLVWRKLGLKVMLFVLVVGVMISVVVGGIYFIYNFRTTSLILAPQEQMIASFAIVMFFAISTFMFAIPTIVGGGLIAVFVKVVGSSSILGEKTGKRPVIYQVPSNHIWVLRNAFGSKPGNPLYYYNHPEATDEEKEKEAKSEGYTPKTEGYSYRIPIWHVDEGVYDLEPKQRDCKKIEIKSKDKLAVLVNLQITTKIDNAVRFAISMEGTTVEEKEKKRIEVENALLHTATNRACRRYTAVELQGVICRINNKDESEEVRKKYWSLLRQHYKTKTEKVINGDDIDYIIPDENDKNNKVDCLTCKISVLWKLAIAKYRLRKKFDEKESAEKKKKVYESYFDASIPLGDEIKTELKNLFIHQQYGILVGQIGVQDTTTPNDIQEALQRREASKIELKAAPDEGKAIKTIIDATGSDATATTITQMIVDLFRGRVGAPRQSSKKSSKKSK